MERRNTHPPARLHAGLAQRRVSLTPHQERAALTEALAMLAGEEDRTAVTEAYRAGATDTVAAAQACLTNAQLQRALAYCRDTAASPWREFHVAVLKAKAEYEALLQGQLQAHGQPRKLASRRTVEQEVVRMERTVHPDGTVVTKPVAVRISLTEEMEREVPGDFRALETILRRTRRGEWGDRQEHTHNWTGKSREQKLAYLYAQADPELQGEVIDADYTEDLLPIEADEADEVPEVPPPVSASPLALPAGDGGCEGMQGEEADGQEEPAPSTSAVLALPDAD